VGPATSLHVVILAALIGRRWLSKWKLRFISTLAASSNRVALRK
jgi:hypothetical protein